MSSDIDTEVVGSLNVLDPRRPIREADMLSVRTEAESQRGMWL